MKLFALPNLASATCAEVEPWSLKMAVPASVKTKEQFIALLQKKETKHCCYSGYEGLDPMRRVSTANAAQLMRALVLDYDCGGPGADSWEEMVADAVKFKGVAPNWISRTFSGGARAVWLFDRPALVHLRVWKRALDALIREEGFDKLFHSIDRAGYRDASKYYALGDSWTSLGTSSLESDRLYSHVLKESPKASWVIDSERVSLEDVAAEVEKRFPNRWSGPFEVGARGLRFWDETADNPTAAIVRESGMQCFTGVEPFVTWSRIFGAKWVNDRQAEKVGAATRDVWFDGQSYWIRVDDKWVDASRQDTLLHFKVMGLSSEGEPNEIETALFTAQRDKRVDAAVPLVFHPEGIVPVMGMKYLNTSSVRPIPPADRAGEWGDGFPRLADFLGGLLELVEGEDVQTPHFLAWLRRYYKSAVDVQPRPGQVVFLAGEVEQGKTFTSNVILSRLLGGSADASSYLMGDTTFTSHLFNSPLWTIDDTLAGREESHAYYSSMIKKMPANQLFLFNEKFKRVRVVPWLGRVIVTCNLDKESMRIIPNAEQSLLDKIMLFKIQTRDGIDFKALYDALPDELPVFARWLLEWDPNDDGVLEYSRFGVSAYHHPELLEAAREVMPSHGFYELLMIFLQGYFGNDAKATEWRGSSTSLVREISIDDSLKALVARHQPRVVGRYLAQLSGQGYPIKQIWHDQQRMWVVDRSFLTATPCDKHQE